MDVNNCTYFHSTNCSILIGKSFGKRVKKVKKGMKIPLLNCLKIFQKESDSYVIEEVYSKITTAHYKNEEATYDENNNLVAWKDKETGEDFHTIYEEDKIRTSSNLDFNRDSAYFSSNDTPTKNQYFVEEKLFKLNLKEPADDRSSYPNKKLSCNSGTLVDYVTKSDVARVSQRTKVVSICEQILMKNTNNRHQGEIRKGCETSADLSRKCVRNLSFFGPDKIFSFHSLTIDQISALILSFHQALTKEIQPLPSKDFSFLVHFTSALCTYLENKTNIVFIRGLDLEGLIDIYNEDRFHASAKLKKIFINLWTDILLCD